MTFFQLADPEIFAGAPCTKLDPDLSYAEMGEKRLTYGPRIEQAKAACARCPMATRAACLKLAMDAEGQTPGESRTHARCRRKARGATWSLADREGEAMNIREIRKRAEAATPGPWSANGGDVRAAVYADGRTARIIYGGMPYDAEFIAHAREDVPALLAEVERLRGENEWLREHKRTAQAERDSLRAFKDEVLALPEQFDVEPLRAVRVAIIRALAAKRGIEAS